MQSSSKTYLTRLDHLRFLAALMVLFWHSMHRFIPVSYVPRWRYFPLSLLEEGHTGVALFMTLSGFIFMALCRDKEVVYSEFIRNRFLRIAPLFCFWFAIQIWTTTPAFDTVHALSAILTMNDPVHLVPGVGWTILVEFQFYLLFPFLLRFYRDQGVKILFGVLLLSVMNRFLIYMNYGSVQNQAYWSIFGRIDQFVLGMLACELYHRRPAWLQSYWVFGTSVLSWMLLVHLFNLRGGYYDYQGPPPSTTRMWIVIPTLEGAFYGLWTACWLSCPMRLPKIIDDSLAWMGKLSFSFYLNHMVAVELCSKLLQKYPKYFPTNFKWALVFALFVVLPITTLMSAVTYYVIELPFLSLRRSYFAVPKVAEQPAAGPRIAA